MTKDKGWPRKRLPLIVFGLNISFQKKLCLNGVSDEQKNPIFFVQFLLGKQEIKPRNPEIAQIKTI